MIRRCEDCDAPLIGRVHLQVVCRCCQHLRDDKATQEDDAQFSFWLFEAEQEEDRKWTDGENDPELLAELAKNQNH